MSRAQDGPDPDHEEPTNFQPLNGPRKSKIKPLLVILAVLALLVLGYVAALAFLVD